MDVAEVNLTTLTNVDYMKRGMPFKTAPSSFGVGAFCCCLQYVTDLMMQDELCASNLNLTHNSCMI